MTKVVGDYSTEVLLEAEEAKKICKIGKGSDCCAFLTVGAEGFSCQRLNYPFSTIILQRLEAGTMNAKGRGGWEGCAWGKELKEGQHEPGADHGADT